MLTFPVGFFTSATASTYDVLWDFSSYTDSVAGLTLTPSGVTLNAGQAEFDGFSYMSILSNSLLQQSGSVTIDIDFTLGSVFGYQAIFAKWNDSPLNSEYLLVFNGANLEMDIRNNADSTNYVVTCFDSITGGTANSLRIKYDRPNTTLSMQLNGGTIYTNTAALELRVSNAEFVVGAFSNGHGSKISAGSKVDRIGIAQRLLP